MNSPLLDRPVGQLVAEKPARSRVFERWGIDYCCAGKKALSEACAAKNVDADAVVQELEQSDATAQQPSTDWTRESLSRLCDHIQEQHHAYLREALPRASMLVDKVADRHGARDPRLVELAGVFAAFRGEMEEHTGKEDVVLFPAIRSLEEPGAANPIAHFISQPIQAMLADHDSAGAALEKMSELTDGFTPDAGACNTHRAMLQALEEIEGDTHQHVHKENNILFPRAIELSAKL